MLVRLRYVPQLQLHAALAWLEVRFLDALACFPLVRGAVKLRVLVRCTIGRCPAMGSF
jgi:hypothetical protein